MSQVPYDENLKIEYFSHVFDRNRISNCYKYFWLMAILRKISPDKTVFTYDELITEMVADAWYMVAEYHLRLGPTNTTDNLEEAVKYVYLDLNKEKIPSTEKREILVAYLSNLIDKKYQDYKSKLIFNVPYCMQSPFYDPTLKKPSQYTIDIINSQKRLFYYFAKYNGLNTEITISDEWLGYLYRNKAILIDWVRYNLIGYLQDRNPSVPGIADKILPPYKRKLEKAKVYWKAVIMADGSLRDIYGGNLLSDIDISLDHFVPWQYVAHDELWNLHPTTKSINSSKSNGLPEWDLYFDPLYRLEYLSYTLSKENEKIAEAFDKVSKYHLNNEEIARTLYCTGLTEGDFGERLSNVIRPIYNAAKNSGFREWRYEEAACQY